MCRFKNVIAFTTAVAVFASLAACASAQSAIDATTGKPEAHQSGINDAGVPGSQPAAFSAAPRNVAATRGPANGVLAAGDLSEKIAACLVLGNQEELALAEIAQQRAEHPEVKKFAAHMIEQHQAAVAKLQQAVPQVAGVALGDTQHGSAQAQKPAQAAGQTQPAQPSHELEMAKAVKQQCLQLTKQEMEGKQGAEFDKCYIGQQIGAHVAMLAELRGTKSYANPQLQAVISEGEKMATHHLEQAKEIMKALDAQNATSRTTQRPAPATR